MIEELKKLRVGKVVVSPLMKNYTTYKVGGEALALVYPDSYKNLIKLMKYINKNNIKYMILGKGSNVIFKDTKYEGIIINLKELNNLNIDDTVVTVEAGYDLTKLALKVARLGLSGLEFAAGIPGSVGGAIYMNAGAYKEDMSFIVSEVKVLTKDLDIKILYNKDLKFGYRDSILQHKKGYICLEAKLVLKQGDSLKIREVIQDRKQRRLLTQPLEYPSAGSVFRNPENDYAGRLIEELGYKGKNIGGAYVSCKHANFIINKDNATASDIRNLIKEIKAKVKEEYNIDLKVEQKFID